MAIESLEPGNSKKKIGRGEDPLALMDPSNGDINELLNLLENDEAPLSKGFEEDSWFDESPSEKDASYEFGDIEPPESELEEIDISRQETPGI